MCHLYYVMEHFVDWIKSRYYDFCDVPIELKTRIDPSVESKVEYNCEMLGEYCYQCAYDDIIIECSCHPCKTLGN